MDNNFLQVVNVALTGGVLLALLRAVFAHGVLTQKVDGHEKRIDKIESIISIKDD